MMLTDAQAAELAKYPAAYERPNYRMSRENGRFVQCSRELWESRTGGGYLDVSCGRGEMLTYARAIGFSPVVGTETVEALLTDGVVYALAWGLPFPAKSFDVVSLFDVIEHLLPGDDELACRELARVAKRTIILTTNNLPSLNDGVELHVNKRPYPEWDRLFREWFPGRVHWLRHRKAKKSEMWRVEL